MSRLLSLFVAGLLLTVVVGCGGDKPDEKKDDPKSAAVKPVNQFCPMMPDNEVKEVTDKTPTLKWDGKLIVFCCSGCDEKFKALDEEEKAATLASAVALNK